MLCGEHSPQRYNIRAKLGASKIVAAPSVAMYVQSRKLCEKPPTVGCTRIIFAHGGWVTNNCKIYANNILLEYRFHVTKWRITSWTVHIWLGKIVSSPLRCPPDPPRHLFRLQRIHEE